MIAATIIPIMVKTFASGLFFFFSFTLYVYFTVFAIINSLYYPPLFSRYAIQRMICSHTKTAAHAATATIIILFSRYASKMATAKPTMAEIR